MKPCGLPVRNQLIAKQYKRPVPPVLSRSAWLQPLVAFDEFQEEPLPIRSEWPTCAEPVELLVQLLHVWSALSV
jgi:hypothetical protein